MDVHYLIVFALSGEHEPRCLDAGDVNDDGIVDLSDAVVLLMFGDAKRKVYEEAKESGSLLPVASLLKQKKAPVHLYWAP